MKYKLNCGEGTHIYLGFCKSVVLLSWINQQQQVSLSTFSRLVCVHMALCLCLWLSISRLLHVWCARKLGLSACTRHEWQSCLHIATSIARPLSITSTLLIRVIFRAEFDFHLRIQGETVVGTVMARGMFVKIRSVNIFPIFHPTVKAGHTDLM